MGGGTSIDSAADARPIASSRSWPPVAAIVGGGILLLALLLRILGARGALWLDEIWSLKLIDEVRARHDVLWGIAVDNNHYLNTLYLALVGADAPLLVQRALSILLGILTVLVAGIVARRDGLVAALVAMVLFAISYPMVNYASEARGYAGLILATLCAVLLTQSAAAGSKRDRLRLGFANLAGALFQPIMLGEIACLMAWAAWLRRPVGKITPGAIVTTGFAAAETFLWTVRLLLPFAAIVAISVMHAGGYRIAGSVPFTAQGFVLGYGGLVNLLLGLPDAVPPWVGLAIAAAAMAIVAVVARGDGNHRLSLYFFQIVGLPLAMFVARLPNIFFPRYYLASGVVFLLLLADLFARAWKHGGVLRGIAVLLLAAFAAGNAVNIARLVENGRDQSVAMMRLIGDGGPVMVSSDQDARNRVVVEYFAHRLNLPVTYIASDQICAHKVTWMLSSWPADEMPDAIDTSTQGCMIVYRKEAVLPQWGLSGLPWTVYRAE